MDHFEMADDPAVKVPRLHHRCKSRGSQMRLLGFNDEYWGSLDRIGQLMSDLIMWRDIARSSLWFAELEQEQHQALVVVVPEVVAKSHMVVTGCLLESLGEEDQLVLCQKMESSSWVTGLGIELLNPSNYKIWRSCMESYLVAYATKPKDDADADDLKWWVMTNAKAEFVLKRSVSHGLFEHIIKYRSANDIWETLDRLFNKKDIGRLQGKCFLVETSTIDAMAINFKDEWIVDSGCGHHLTAMVTEDNTMHQVEKKGTVIINDGVICEGCQFGKAHRLPFAKSDSRSKEFKETVDSVLGLKIKCLRTDNGGEFTSKSFFKFCRQFGIKRQLSCVETPQQNGRGKLDLKAKKCIFVGYDERKKFCGYRASDSDSTLFVKKYRNLYMFVLFYVDDMIVTGSDENEIVKLRAELSTRFNTMNLGKLSHFLGLEVKNMANGIFMSQQGYAQKLVERFGLKLSKKRSTPLDKDKKLRRKERSLLPDPKTYRALLGSLLYLTITRLDIAFAVGIVGRYLQEPRKPYLEAAKDILKYVSSTLDFGLLYKRGAGFVMNGYIDADFGRDIDDRRSTSDYVFLCDSTKPEYKAASFAAQECVWLRRLIKDVYQPRDKSTTLFCDNQSAIKLSSNPVFHARTKHIEIEHHFIREKVLDGTIKNKHVSSKENVADIFTKALSRGPFEALHVKLGLISKTSL
ncbi:hypothetical protein D8674_019692 [Pyrus ussuriensis x Pyrus communis]|uniref:Integrase catalytic domain-containing protein n=1 Tax=Pyrus ussuriensis x Pyrus communis TaxID=2448454 RepID=A0A5N5GDV3_9ROSA|nr:hypothetical protein D8674_019692 [Pyrus ussuriensis x Pyrus communis]